MTTWIPTTAHLMTLNTAHLMGVLDTRGAATARAGSTPRWTPIRGATSPFALHELRTRSRS